MVQNGYDLMKEISSEGKSRMLVMRRQNHRPRFVAFNADYEGPRHHPPKNN